MTTPRLTAFALVALAASAPPAAAAPADVVVEKDIAYLAPDRAEKADLYRPKEARDGRKFPAVVIIHGGGWVGGDKRAAREVGIGTTLAEHGYVGLSINYLLSNDAHKVTWPQNLHDCKAAVRWLRTNAERLNVDPDHIGVIGGSAGGHLSAMVAATAGDPALDPPGEVSTRVQAAVIMYAPADLTNADRGWLGKTRAEAPALYKLASPLSHLDRSDPPFLILHGTADKLVEVEQSRLLDSAVAAAGLGHQLVIIEGAPHTFGLENKQKDLRPLVVGFFDTHLKPAR